MWLLLTFVTIWLEREHWRQLQQKGICYIHRWLCMPGLTGTLATALLVSIICKCVWNAIEMLLKDQHKVRSALRKSVNTNDTDPQTHPAPANINISIKSIAISFRFRLVDGCLRYNSVLFDFANRILTKETVVNKYFIWMKVFEMIVADAVG